MPKITVVLPTYNERDNLPRIVSAVLAQPLAGLNLLIVDDNSPDGSGDVAEELARAHPGRVEVLHRPEKQGLGPAYVQGFQHALRRGADCIAQMDADFSHPPQTLVQMADLLAHYDVVLGSRYVSGGALDTDWPFWRKALSRFGNAYARAILGMKARDVTGGYRMWRAETLAAIPWERVRSNGYAFQIEMLYIAARLGFRIAEIPIYFAERQAGRSKMSLRIQIEAALRVWQIRFAYRDLEALEPDPLRV
ncbi:MAG: polyprenol monophosphomannose synthase [Anaerolineae bacterium]|nr:MAG: polyprenol monophosphomannose synthase [Anaerolineae bacterium]